MKRTEKQLQIIFHTFAQRECAEVSPLYYNLAQAVAQNQYLLQLASQARARQPIPNLFFGAIHYLLLLDPTHPLAQYYPSISKEPSKEIPKTLFHEFCKKNETEIIRLLANRIVQTNAINRTAYLMPIASSRFAGSEELTLIDIGCSSGLVMNFDQYSYQYSDQASLGHSPVQVRSELRSGRLPDFAEIIKVRQKIGIDQNPLDIRDPDNARWLKALIWPDMTARFERLTAAIALAQEAKGFQMIQGSSRSDFEAVIKGVRSQSSLLIYHTHVLYQFRVAERLAFRQLLDAIGRERNFLYLAAEHTSVFDDIISLPTGIQLVLTTYHKGVKTVEHLGETNGHANWIRWHNKKP